MKAPWWSTTRGDVTVALSYCALLVLCAVAQVGRLGWADGWGSAQFTSWVGAATTLPGVAGVALRHKTPRISLVAIALSAAGTLVLGFSVGAFVMLFELLFTLYLLGGSKGPTAARAVAAGLSATLVIGTVVAGGNLSAVLNAALVAAVALWFPVLWAADLHQADALRAAERERANEARRNAATTARLAVAQERARMAGELHDTVSGHLSAIALQSQAAALTPDDAARGRILEEIRSGSLQALGHMRELIRVLTADEPQPESVGGVADFPALAERARAAGHLVTLRLDADPEMLDAAGQAAAFRVASEGVTNAMKHAPGCAVEIGLRCEGAQTAIVEVLNGPALADAPAVEGPRGNGLGLEQLRIRLEPLGGSLRAAASSEGGWSLLARLPLRQDGGPEHHVRPRPAPANLNHPNVNHPNLNHPSTNHAPRKPTP